MAGPARTITPLPVRLGRTRPKSYSDMIIDRTDGEEHRLRGLVAKAFDGKLNNTGTLTLATGGATTTDIEDSRIGPTTLAVLVGLDQNGAASIPTISQSVLQPGTIRLTHAASALTRTIGFVLFGILVLGILAGASWAQSPSLIGIPQSSAPACGAGEYWLSVDSTETEWKKCANGTINDLDTGIGGTVTELDQSVGETDFRYDSTLEAYYYDTDGGGTRATDGTEPFLDTQIVEVPLDYATIQAAIDSNDIGKGSTANIGGTVRLGRGTYTQSFELGGIATTDYQNSIGVEGVGFAGWENGSSVAVCGATLLGDDSASNTVVKASGLIGWSLRNFCIDMNDAPTNDPIIGIHAGYVPTGGGDPVGILKHGEIANVNIQSGSSSSIGIKLGNDGPGSPGLASADAAFNTIRNYRAVDIGTALVVSGQQVVTNKVDGMECAQPKAAIGCVSVTEYGGEIVLEDLHMTPGIADQIGVNSHNSALGILTIRRANVEWDEDNGTMFKWQNPGAVSGIPRAVSIYDSRMQPQTAPTGNRYCIDFERVGVLNVVNSNIESGDATWTCSIRVRNPSATQPLFVNWIGNHTAFGNATSDIGFDRSTAGGKIIVTVVDQGRTIICEGAGSGITAGSAGCRVVDGSTILSADVTCALSASYCTIFTIPAALITASRALEIDGRLLVDADSTTVAPQFRVSSADTGYSGHCQWTANESTVATDPPSTDIVAIGTAPADTGGTTWFSTAAQIVRVQCALVADASPGDIVIEFQLETGTTPTQTVLRGSSYAMRQ